MAHAAEKRKKIFRAEVSHLLLLFLKKVYLDDSSWRPRRRWWWWSLIFDRRGERRVCARWYIARISENVGTLVLLFQDEKEESIWSGVALYSLPSGGVSPHTGWKCYGFPKKLPKLSNLRPRTQRVGEKSRIYFSFRWGIDGSFFSLFPHWLNGTGVRSHLGQQRGMGNRSLSFRNFFALFLCGVGVSAQTSHHVGGSRCKV